MTLEIYDALVKLKDALKDDKRVIVLKEIEQELENDDQAKIYSYQVDCATREYNDALKIYDMEHEIAKAKQKNLYEKKCLLDSLDIVKKYNKAYKEVYDLFALINDEIFLPLSPSLCKARRGK